MTLLPDKYNLTKQMKYWQTFADCGLDTQKEKEEFRDMLNDYYRYAMVIINSQTEHFPSKPLIIRLLLSQYEKITQWIIENS
jgi:hypothetical protein